MCFDVDSQPPIASHHGLPVRTEDPEKHVLKPERFDLSADAAACLNRARRDGRRIVAVGTTTTRTLEYVAQKYGRFEKSSGEADIFILPGYQFKAVNAMQAVNAMPTPSRAATCWYRCPTSSACNA